MHELVKILTFMFVFPIQAHGYLMRRELDSIANLVEQELKK